MINQPMNLPLRAVPRAELEINGQRVIEDATGDLIALVTFNEDAEEIALAVNQHQALRGVLADLLGVQELNYDDPREEHTEEVVARAWKLLEEK